MDSVRDLGFVLVGDQRESPSGLFQALVLYGIDVFLRCLFTMTGIC